MAKSICFLMPGPENGPIGGYKIVYEYANRFVAINWDVHIVYPLYLESKHSEKLLQRLIKHPRSTILAIAATFKIALKSKFCAHKWFPLDSRVKRHYVLTLNQRFARKLSNDTRFIATFAWTALCLHEFNVKYKYFFIQDFETWGGTTEDELSAILKLDLRKIAISEWLCDKVKQLGEKVKLIPNGLDFEYFVQSCPIKERNPFEIAMLWHSATRKRTTDAFEALKIVHKRHQRLHVTAFGAQEPQFALPNWFTFVKCPDRETHNQIYNHAAIFVASSEQEGWGLTLCEAMICGAAVACTDIGGYRMFAIDGETALMSPVYNQAALADNICKLIEDSDLRTKIASNGSSYVRQFTWDKSFTAMKELLELE